MHKTHSMMPLAVVAMVLFALHSGAASARGAGMHSATGSLHSRPGATQPGSIVVHASRLPRGSLQGPAGSAHTAVQLNRQASPTASPRPSAPATPAAPGTTSILSIGPPGPPAAVAPSTDAPPTLAAPAPQAPAIAPLPPQLSTQFSSGGSPPQSNLALSPGAASASPSESAPSAPGGGGKGLAACMGFWDAATHMTKAEWRTACQRTMQEYPSVR
jgi:hypothetical protein